MASSSLKHNFTLPLWTVGFISKRARRQLVTPTDPRKKFSIRRHRFVWVGKIHVDYFPDRSCISTANNGFVEKRADNITTKTNRTMRFLAHLPTSSSVAMDPEDRLRGGCEAFRDTELIFTPPIELLPPPEEPEPEPVVTPEAEINSDNAPFWCPLEFCQPPLRCQWYGATTEALYQHFVNEPERHVADYAVVEVKVVNEPTLCEWPNYASICDDDSLIGGYLLLMKKDPDMYFFFAAGCAGVTTTMNVCSIDQDETYIKYSCKMTIENRGDEAAAPINLTFTCVPNDTKSNMLVSNILYGKELRNEPIRSCCAENGSLYFLMEPCDYFEEVVVIDDEVIPDDYYDVP